MRTGRPSIDIAPHRDLITSWILERKWNIPRVVDALQLEFNITLSHNTLKRNLQAWGVTTRPRLVDSEALRKRITDIFYQDRYHTDEQIASMLEQDGFTINTRKLGRLRKHMGLVKRCDTKLRTVPAAPPANADADPLVTTASAAIASASASTPQPPRLPAWQTHNANDPERRARRHRDRRSIAAERRFNAASAVRSAPVVRPVTADEPLPAIDPAFTTEPASIEESAPLMDPASPASNISADEYRIDIDDLSDDDRWSPEPGPGVDMLNTSPNTGGGVARRVTGLATRMESLETENKDLKTQLAQQRNTFEQENAALKQQFGSANTALEQQNRALGQQIEQQRAEMTLMRGTLNELITRFNLANY